MAGTTPGGTGGGSTRDAVGWLVAVAPDPAACRRQWERDPSGTVLLPAGQRWDVLTLPASLGGPALDVLIRLVERPGPVLADSGEERMGFFVPPGTAARWLGTGVRGAGRGTWIVVPHPGGRAYGLRWLVPPDGSGALTDPAILELALHEAAAALGEGGGRVNGERGADPGRGKS
ncbi:hypothetical protein [Streptomyces sp. NRRL F-5126]|uniref:hypothetical protein n=1 Tax=Streptomyces sp. NRRL F-5126 TaxID=1463857 RepID=UPI0006896565|nr:hypothetical protein [Streptomyces sp. NRRL F-5126]